MAFGFDQLQTFIHVAELGSFTAAADKAGVTQPAVSLQIKLLEQRLGVRLIERVGRRAQPTAAGLEFLDHARRIMRELADAEEAMTPHRNGESGRVRIGSGATASIHLLPLAISRARKKMPGRSFEVEAFYDDELMVVAPRGSVIPHGGPDAAFVNTKPLLLYDGGNTRRTIDEWMGQAGLVARPVMEFGSVEAIKELVAAGLGWSILPGLALKRDRAGFLETAPVSPPLVRKLGMVVRRDKHLSRGLREMMKSLREAGS